MYMKVRFLNQCKTAICVHESKLKPKIHKRESERETRKQKQKKKNPPLRK